MAKAVFITKQGNATSVQIQDGGVTAFSYLFNEPQDMIAKSDGEHIVITESVNQNSPSISFKFSDIDDKLSATTSHEYLEAAATAGLFFSGVSAGGGGTGGSSYTFEGGLTETAGTVTWHQPLGIPGINQHTVSDGEALFIGDFAGGYGLQVAADGANHIAGLSGTTINLTSSGQLQLSGDTQVTINSDDVDISGDSLELIAQTYLGISSPAIVGATAVAGQVLTLVDEGSGECDWSGSITVSNYNLSELNTAPASASDTGTTGQIRITATHIYVCTATDTWVRAALATW